MVENQSISSLQLERDPNIVDNVTVVFAMCCLLLFKRNCVYIDLEMEAASWQLVEALPFGNMALGSLV